MLPYNEAASAHILTLGSAPAAFSSLPKIPWAHTNHSGIGQCSHFLPNRLPSSGWISCVFAVLGKSVMRQWKYESDCHQWKVTGNFNTAVSWH